MYVHLWQENHDIVNAILQLRMSCLMLVSLIISTKKETFSHFSVVWLVRLFVFC